MPPDEERANKCHKWLLYFCLCQLKKTIGFRKKEKGKRKKKGSLLLIKASKVKGLLSNVSGVNYITRQVKKEHLLTRNTRRVITSGQKLNRSLDLKSSVFSGLLTFNMLFF